MLTLASTTQLDASVPPPLRGSGLAESTPSRRHGSTSPFILPAYPRCMWINPASRVRACVCTRKREKRCAARERTEKRAAEPRRAAFHARNGTHILVRECCMCACMHDQQRGQGAVGYGAFRPPRSPYIYVPRTRTTRAIRGMD